MALSGEMSLRGACDAAISTCGGAVQSEIAALRNDKSEIASLSAMAFIRVQYRLVAYFFRSQFNRFTLGYIDML
ncbi:hypothetical protein HSBAA_23040 [Vreelandella sulfidaeris]|uniref:Uncharacterized protein n=1 Tax=Vreelandella sulfidaeris TaxID=115553 RepID=A0A455U9Q9_9GAMM|nr:hypothetical protein HSBAA_23040 [Halomonas sulfidaeris]